MRIHPPVAFVCGSASFLFAVFLLLAHAWTIRDMRVSVLPLLSSLPALEKNYEILREQVDLAELHSALETGSEEERLYAYVLPARGESQRLMSMFDVLRDVYEKRGIPYFLSPITVGEAYSEGENLSATPVFLQMELTKEGTEEVLTLLRFAGLLTVSDVLSAQELSLLLSHAQEENPAGIIALEKFLGSDLLQYSVEPEAVHRELERSFTSPGFLALLRDITSTPLLRDAGRILGGDIGAALESRRAWPLPFLEVRAADMRHLPSGRVRLELHLVAYSRD